MRIEGNYKYLQFEKRYEKINFIRYGTCVYNRF